jgi:hypothetical protein
MTILSAIYANSQSDAVIVQVQGMGLVAIQLSGEDNSGGLRPSYLAYHAANGTAPYVAPPIDTVALAEQHIESYFSTARLLQMKVWWDTFPHEATPKLGATFAWADAITRSAIQGETSFDPPPFTFQEIAAESLSIIP